MVIKDLIPLYSALAAAFGAIVAAVISYRIQKKKLEHEFEAQSKRLATEFATEESVEAALKHFLELSELPYRSFQMIRHHIGGFEANELRRLLVRSGAVRFMAADGSEMWALRERVPEQFKIGRWKLDESPRNKTPEDDLFPKALGDDEQF